MKYFMPYAMIEIGVGSDKTNRLSCGGVMEIKNSPANIVQTENFADSKIEQKFIF